MSQESPPIEAPVPKKFNKKLIVSAILIASSFLVFGVLTKAGIVPNFLNVWFLCSDDSPEPVVEDFGPMLKKPVIYLYPEHQQNVTVRLDYDGELFATYPQYDKNIHGWNVVAYPDGKLVDIADNREYSYIFWEGKPTREKHWDWSSGFVIRGADTREFLQKTLSDLGLTPKEYNEFIVYWYPIMKNNPYNLIRFAGTEYTDTAPLSITPKPDSVLRVFMVFKPLTEQLEIPAQKLVPFERKGFSVVEWGGSEIH